MATQENQPIHSDLKEAKKNKENGIGGGFLLSAIFLCLTSGFAGGIFQSCGITFDSKDDRAICYYRSVVNVPFFDNEHPADVIVPKPTVEKITDVKKDTR